MSFQFPAAGRVFAEPLWPNARESGRVAPMRMFDDRDGCKSRVIKISPEIVVADFLVPGTCRIFSGHYPKFPLLPGVFMIEAALQAVEMAQVHGADDQVALGHLSNVQLLQAVVPNQWVNVEASRLAVADDGQGSTWRARLSVGGRRVASCTLAFGEGWMPTAAPESRASIAQDAVNRLTAAEIATRLAHRPPILLVDGAWRSNDGQSLRAHKNIGLNDPCYESLAADVDEAELAYPQTLTIESFVQSAGLLLLPDESGNGSPDSPLMIFGGLGGCRFHGHALPGETLTHHVRLTRRIGDMAVLDGSTSVNGRVLAQFSGLIVAMKRQADLVTQPVSTKSHRIG